MERGFDRQCHPRRSHAGGDDNSVRQSIQVDSTMQQLTIRGDAANQAGDLTRQRGDDG